MKNRKMTSGELVKLAGVLACFGLALGVCGCKDEATETSTTPSAQSATTASTTATTASTEATTATTSSRSSSSGSSGTSSTSPTSGIPNLVTTSDGAGAGAGSAGGSDMGLGAGAGMSGGTSGGGDASSMGEEGASGDGSASDALPADSALDPSATDESLPSDASADSGTSSSDIPSEEGDIPDLPITDPSYIATQSAVQQFCLTAVDNGWDVFYADRGFGSGDREHVYTMYVCAVIENGADGQSHRVDCEIGGQPVVWWCTQVGGTTAESIGAVTRLYNTNLESVTNYLVSYGLK